MPPRSARLSLLLSSWWALAWAGNWKQLLGKRAQPNTYSRDSGFAPRWGHASCVLNYDDQTERVLGKSRLFVLGGDDFDGATGRGGLHNDVWTSFGEAWKVYQHFEDRNKNGDALPRVVSKVQWDNVQPTKNPPRGVTYRSWISCDAEAPPYALVAPPGCNQLYPPGPGQYKGKTRWSPRRNHRAIALGRNIYVFFGRTLAAGDMRERDTVGGILSAGLDGDASRARKVLKATRDNLGENTASSNAAPSEGKGGARGPLWRTPTRLVNDVWKSPDRGKTWELVNPGCLSPQQEVQRGKGRVSDQCVTNNDCYGNARCEDFSCICDSPEPREGHALTVDEETGYMYLYGGFVDRSVHKCGPETTGTNALTRKWQENLVGTPVARKSGDEWACGGGARGYMSDVWRTRGSDMPGTRIMWVAVSKKAPWAGRGFHAAFIMENVHFLVGGKTGHTWVGGVGGGEDGEGEEGGEEYLNDVWYSRDGRGWEQRKDFSCSQQRAPPGGRAGRVGGKCVPWQAEWLPRAGHQAVVIPKSVQMPTSVVFLFGGETSSATRRNESVYLNDVWSWHSRPGESWNVDYDHITPHFKYVSADSKLEALRVKERRDKQVVHFLGMAEDLVQLEDIPKFEAYGIFTIGDLATLGRDMTLRMRTEPDPARRIESVCAAKELARYVRDKCSTPAERLDPTALELLATGEVATGGSKNIDDFAFRNARAGDPAAKAVDPNAPVDADAPANVIEEIPEPEAPDEWVLTKAAWDGCQQIGDRELDPSTGEMGYAAIDGVSQVQVVPDVWRVGEWLTCKAVFKPRAYHTGHYFKGKAYLIGGRTDPVRAEYTNDMWAREAADTFPVTQMTKMPEDHSSETTFTFDSDQAGCVFEWRVVDWADNTVELNWTIAAETAPVTAPSTGKVELTWLAAGYHRFRVRAIDSAGHKEETFREGENQHTWYYVRPIPWMLIIGMLLGAVAFALAVFLEIRRRRRKKAMERYAIKRMRRKFAASGKAKKTDAADWKKVAKVKTGGAKKKGGKLKSGEVHHKHKRKTKHKKGEGGAHGGGGGGGDAGGHSHEHRHHGHKHHEHKHKGK